MQNPVRRQASVALPESEPIERPDSYRIERQNQKKVVLLPCVWQASCKLLRVSHFRESFDLQARVPYEWFWFTRATASTNVNLHLAGLFHI